MCYDGETDTIYVFGGRVLTSSAANVLSDAERSITEFSGLYSYKVATDTWSLLREDSGNAGPQDIRSRIGHSMLLDAVSFLNLFQSIVFPNYFSVNY